MRFFELEYNVSDTINTTEDFLNSNDFRCERANYRPSVDSNISIDQLSACSPSTSNQPEDDPALLTWVKREEIVCYDSDSSIIPCDVKMEAIVLEEEEQPVQASNQVASDEQIDSVSQPDTNSLKRERSNTDIYSETSKKQKTDGNSRENGMYTAFSQENILF